MKRKKEGRIPPQGKREKKEISGYSQMTKRGRKASHYLRLPTKRGIRCIGMSYYLEFQRGGEKKEHSIIFPILRRRGNTSSLTKLGKDFFSYREVKKREHVF